MLVWYYGAIIKVYGEALENVDYFQYLRIALLAKAVIDVKIQHHFQYARAAFGCLANIPSIEASTIFDQLQWTGPIHVTIKRLPKPRIHILLVDGLTCRTKNDSLRPSMN
eukprot:g45929.t1